MENKSQELRKEACPKCRQAGKDNSGNNLSIYLNNDGTESAHCWSCKYTRASSSHKKDTFKDRYEYGIQMAGEFTLDMWEKFRHTTGSDPKKWCALTEETCKKYGVRHQYDEKGSVTFQYYPITKNNDLVGIKWRSADKKWFNKGEADSTCDLFGQVSFISTSSKNVIISSGEKDALSIYQALNEYCKTKGWETPPVVCSVTGEGGYKQYQNNYEWLNRFEKIIICPDNDEPGQQHLHNLVKVLPRNKVYIMDLPYKDANECLQKGKTGKIIDGMFKPRSYTPSGIVGSDVLKQALLDGIRKTKIPLPPFLRQLQDMLRGGIRLPSIVNIVGPTGIGKALPLYAKVLTLDGWKCNKDLTLQDKVITPKNTIANIVGIYDHEDKPIYRFTLQSGRTVDSCSEHLWKARVVKKNNRVYTTTDIFNTSDIVDKVNSGKFNVSLPVSDPIEFNSEEKLPLDPYLLGILIAEGSLSKNSFSITSADSFVVDKINDILIKDYNYSARQKGSTISYSLTIPENRGIKDSNLLYNQLDLLQLAGRDSYTKFIPSLYLNSSIQDRFNLLQGLMDGDGTVSKQSSSLSYSTSSEQLAKDVQQLVFSLGGLAKIRVKDPTYKYKGVIKQGALSYEVRISLKEPRLAFTLPRKLERCALSYQGGAFDLMDKICAVEYVSNQDCRCIMIDDEDHLYLTDDFVVTHNTTYVNELLYFWIYNSPYKMGILSLEADRSEYSNVLVSRHIGVKLNLLDDLEAEVLITSEEVDAKIDDLYHNEDGSPRFYLMEERDGKLENIKKLIEQLIIACGCRIIVIDPIQDLFAGLSIGEQEEFSAWLKVTIKAYDVCFICINHIRKSQGGNVDARYSEQEVKGSSTLIQSSFLTILLNREKEPDPTLSETEQKILMSTMTHRISKNRATGLTGDGGSLFYDNTSHTLYSLDEYKIINPELFEPSVSTY